jgi:transcriptional regulator with XRE-family HTH domain
MKKRNFINRIISIRKKEGLTVNAAAKQSGLNQSTWHRMETGESTPTWDALFQMSDSLGIFSKIVISE